MTASTPVTPSSATSFLDAVSGPVREQLSSSIPLRDFLESARALSVDERLTIVDQALILLEENYVHLPLKRAMHAVDPVQRLRLLRARLEKSTAADEPEWRFHAEVSEIFHSVRDLHTNYLLPEPFAGKVAYLPFLIEEYIDGGERRYLVSHIVDGYTAPGFAAGADVTHWSGIPIARAVEVNAARFAGSNDAARRSRGVESLTVRPLRTHIPPDEEWVTVGYIGADGVARELREPWLVADNLPPFAALDAVTTTSTSLGVDLEADEVSRAKKLLFAPEVVAQERRGDVVVASDSAAVGKTLASNMPGVFRARTVTTASGTFGHIRIFTFGVDDPVAFVDEFIRLVEQLPPDGLIIDVRGNGGGHIHASEFTLQTLTPQRVVPEPVQFISTALNRRICEQHKGNPTGEIDLGLWHRSLEQALQTGAVYSAAFPITPEDGANAVGQRYHGPVVLITDARCYSATDIFAAGFADHGIGTILGVDDNTGAGGANVWTHGLLQALLSVPEPDPESPYVALPQGADMRVSIRRTLRTGALAGTPLEDLGVVPDEIHAMTRRDVLEGNADLLDHAGAILAAQPSYRLSAPTATVTDGRLVLQFHFANIDRIDVYVDDRPRASRDVPDGTSATVALDIAAGSHFRVDGYRQGTLVASRRGAL